MILRFSATNFKSIKDKVEIWFTPGSSRKNNSHVSDDGCLRVTSIFGANASGKSNLIKGLKFVKRILTDPYYHTRYPAYNWDSDNKISKFEIDFSIKDKSGDYHNYSYMIDVETIGNENDERAKKVSQQSYIYNVVGEKLIDLDKKESGEDGIIFDKPHFLKSSDFQYKDNIQNYWSNLIDISKQKSTLDHYEKTLESLDKKVPLVLFSIKETEDTIKGIESDRSKAYTDLRSAYEELEGCTYARYFEKKYLANHEVSMGEMNIDNQSLSIFDMHDIDIRDFFISLIKDYQKIKQDIPFNYRSVYQKIIKLFRELKGYEIKIEKQDKDCFDLKKKLNWTYSNIESTKEEIAKTLEIIDSNRMKIDETDDESLHRLPLLPLGFGKNMPNAYWDKIKIEPENRKIMKNVYTWFVSSLFILETDDYYLPLNEPNLLTNLSKILIGLDVGIYGLKWKKTGYNRRNRYSEIDEIELIKRKIKENDNRRLEECKNSSIYGSCETSVVLKTGQELNLFSYYMGEESVKKLVTYHDMSKNVDTNIQSESDGTRRLIELASVLLPTDHEKIFIVDELDRRLHPALTLKFMELFLSEEKANKQLIFVTHETRLMTTEILRPDEIWLMSKKAGRTSIEPLDEILQNNPELYSKRTDRLYLDGLLGIGTPNIEM